MEKEKKTKKWKTLVNMFLLGMDSYVKEMILPNYNGKLLDLMLKKLILPL